MSPTDPAALADLLEAKPWPAFCALLIIAVVSLFWLYVRETREHRKTALSVLPVVRETPAALEAVAEELGDMRDTITTATGGGRIRARRVRADGEG